MKTKNTKSTQSKADFIRSMPKASVADVVTKGKAAGLKFSPQYVYAVRGAAKPKRKAAPVVAPVVNGAAASATIERPGPAKARPSAADVLRAAAAELGMEKAIELLTSDRALLQRVTGT
jgi:hypothetical protein